MRASWSDSSAIADGCEVKCEDVGGKQEIKSRTGFCTSPLHYETCIFGEIIQAGAHESCKLHRSCPFVKMAGASMHTYPFILHLGIGETKPIFSINPGQPILFFIIPRYLCYHTIGDRSAPTFTTSLKPGRMICHWFMMMLIRQFESIYFCPAGTAGTLVPRHGDGGFFRNETFETIEDEELGRVPSEAGVQGRNP